MLRIKRVSGRAALGSLTALRTRCLDEIGCGIRLSSPFDPATLVHLEHHEGGDGPTPACDSRAMPGAAADMMTTSKSLSQNLHGQSRAKDFW